MPESATDDHGATAPAGQRHPQPWAVVLALFWVTSAVEGIGVSQVFAFMPLYLQELGLPAGDIPRWVGVLSSAVFVFGLPLVPLWGVWADKYSRKAIILRSALVEALVLVLIAASRQPWELAASLLLAGLQLGNTGVMLAALRDLAPKGRLGTAIALFGASSPVGFAVGPALGGFLVDGLHSSISSVYAFSAALSVGSAAMLAVGFREVRPATTPTGRVLDLAFGAVRGVVTDPATRHLFLLFGVSFLARQMASPFLPLLVERAHGSQVALASAVALVVGTASLMGGLISPMAGALGDRIGFRPVLAASLAGCGLALALMPAAPDVPALAVINVAFAALSAAAGAMVFGLLAEEVPAERRSATLNLVYLPLYLSGIAGPAVGALVVVSGVPTVFVLAGAVLGLGALLAALRRPPPAGG